MGIFSFHYFFVISVVSCYSYSLPIYWTQLSPTHTHTWHIVLCDVKTNTLVQLMEGSKEPNGIVVRIQNIYSRFPQNSSQSMYEYIASRPRRL
jgi:hypothetical protein